LPHAGSEAAAILPRATVEIPDEGTEAPGQFLAGHVVRRVLLIGDVPLEPCCAQTGEDFAERAFRVIQILRERGIRWLFESFADIRGDRVIRITGLFGQFAIFAISGTLHQCSY
jgi:hypothetical protein